MPEILPLDPDVGCSCCRSKSFCQGAFLLFSPPTVAGPGLLHSLQITATTSHQTQSRKASPRWLAVSSGLHVWSERDEPGNLHMQDLLGRLPVRTGSTARRWCIRDIVGGNVGASTPHKSIQPTSSGPSVDKTLQAALNNVFPRPWAPAWMQHACRHGPWVPFQPRPPCCSVSPSAPLRDRAIKVYQITPCSFAGSRPCRLCIRRPVPQICLAILSRPSPRNQTSHPLPTAKDPRTLRDPSLDHGTPPSTGRVSKYTLAFPQPLKIHRSLRRGLAETGSGAPGMAVLPQLRPFERRPPKAA